MPKNFSGFNAKNIPIGAGSTEMYQLQSSLSNRHRELIFNRREVLKNQNSIATIIDLHEYRII